MLKESIKMSWQNIINNKMRSFLTVLGVLIGVASVIALISIVQAVTTNITGQVMDMGANKVSVQLSGTPLKQGLTMGDINELETIENLKGVSPSVVGKTSIVYDGNVMEEVSVQGKNDVHFANTQDLVKSGRSINAIDVESGNRVCLVGQDIVKELFPSESPIDKKIIINGITYTVIGILQESSNLLAGSSNSEVIIPYTTAMSLLSTGYVSTIDFYIEDESLSESTTSNIESVLLSAFNYDENGYTITNMQNILDTVNEMTATMSLLLAGIAAISLIVGGIGIMNMMLVIVTERTTEIGLRKALGAKPSAIQIQFVLEALFLSLFGGIMGLLFGTTISFVGCLLIGVEFTLVSYAIPLAIGFAAAIGLVFGYAPAKRASKLNPIDALRSV
ncbi:MAG: ABC transporter permease [bacterium]|nr:ABC transporter permease [bacterium]